MSHHNPLTNIAGRPLDATAVNRLFGFNKVPAEFSGSTEYNGHAIFCWPSQPNRKHRMMTTCPECGKWLTVGCLPQHMRKMHGPRIKPEAELAYWAERRAAAAEAEAERRERIAQ
jgi:hypothetical protein